MEVTFTKEELELLKDVLNVTNFNKTTKFPDKLYKLYEKLDNAGVADVDFGLERLWDDSTNIKETLLDIAKKINKACK